MPSICVELATLHLQPSLTKGIDQDNTYLDQLKFARAQPGLNALRRGGALEVPDDMYWLVEWNSLEDHKALQEKPIYGPFTQYLGSICTGSPPIELHHFNVDQASLHATMSRPVTEVFTFRVPDGDVDAFASDFSKSFGDVLASKTSAIPLIARSVEDDRQLNVLIGWESVEEHTKAKQHAWFGEEIKKFSAQWSEPKLVHVAFHG